MAYSTQNDIILQLPPDALIQLSGDVVEVGDEDTESDDAITRAIEDADSLIDAYLGVRYSVPLATVPALVRKMSVDLAIFNLYMRRVGTVPDERKAQSEAALKMLDAISRGELSLGAGAPSEQAGSGPTSTTVKTDRVFTRGLESDDSTGTLDNY